MSEAIYKSENLLVTKKVFRTSRRSYKISQIEKVTIKRQILWLFTPIALGLCGLALEYERYLYEHEIAACWILASALILLGFNYGSLCVSSKALGDDVAVYGTFSKLKRVREALDLVMFDLSHNDQ